jgi:hypothetical protein
MLRRIFLLSVGLLSVCALGCASHYMVRSEVPLRIAPRSDAATVVFVRPSSFGAAIHPTIFDERGQFLGDAEASSHFVAEVSPGEHTFVVWAENTGPIHATLAPGRVYFIEVAMKPGAFQARAHLLAIAPRTESWASLREWLADTRPTVADRRAGQAYLDGRKDDVLERLRRAGEAFAEMDAEDRDARTLYPNDGIAQSL